MKLLLRIAVFVISLILFAPGAVRAGSYEKEMSRFSFQEALTQYREGLEKALERMEKYVEANPEDIRAALTLADIYLERDAQESARRLYEKIIKVSPDNKEVHRRLLILYGRGRIPGKILKEYKALVARNPSDLEIRRILARKYVELGRQQDAILQYEEILRQETGDTESREMLADLYLWNGNPADAVRQYRLVLNVEPDNREIGRKAADIYYDFRLYAAAEEYYRKYSPGEKNSRDQQRLEEIDRLRKSRMPARYYYHNRGDDYTHSYYSWGYGQYLSDYFDYTLSYSRHRYDEFGRSVEAGSYRLETTNYLFNYLTFTEQVTVNDYSSGRTHLNGSLTVKKDFIKTPLSLEGVISYEDIVSEMAAIDEGTEATFLEVYLYYNIKPLWSLSSRLKYGSYADDNDEWENEVGLIRHLKKSGPLIDLAYTYNRDSFHYPDTSSKTYPYWNPENYEVHSLLFILSDRKERKMSYLFHETLAWAVQDKALLNGFRLRGDYRFRDGWSLFADYSRTDTLTGSPETRFKEWKVKIGWMFYF